MNQKGLTAPLVKSAAFVVVTVVATAMLALSITRTGGGDTVPYKARFTDASGLREGDSVRIAGAEVGRIAGIEVVEHRVALVSFSVGRGHRLPATSTATIKYLNLIGQRYVELERGTGATGTLKPGSTIPVERTTPALNLTQLFNGFQPLFQALSPKDVNRLAGSIIQVLQGEGGTVEGLLSTVGSLTSGIADKDKVIGQVIENLNVVLDTVNGRGDNLGNLISTLRRLVSGLAADRTAIGSAIGALDDLARTTTDLLKDGREPLKRDIEQLGRLSENLADESPTVDSFLRLLPVKMAAIGRIGSYGSWLNLYLCEADLSGVTYKQYPGENNPPPTGIPLTAKRCGE
ncbi:MULTISPECIES: MCE family protein [unclassified Spirillospora]|uniref:MCE family protein n=1 Tax=unclassified Spirillospora TaxID=2642701 RepID=UPI00371296D6